MRPQAVPTAGCAPPEERGPLIGANDLWIAAQALALGGTLVTDNVASSRRWNAW